MSGYIKKDIGDIVLDIILTMLKFSDILSVYVKLATEWRAVYQ